MLQQVLERIFCRPCKSDTPFKKETQRKSLNIFVLNNNWRQLRHRLVFRKILSALIFPKDVTLKKLDSFGPLKFWFKYVSYSKSIFLGFLHGFMDPWIHGPPNCTLLKTLLISRPWQMLIDTQTWKRWAFSLRLIKRLKSKIYAVDTTSAQDSLINKS